MKLIIGLGNPGQAYANNRHNVGFHCVNRFARANNIAFSKLQARCRVGFGEIAGVKVIVGRPRTFMNVSGEAVSLLARRYDVALGDLLVIHDDLDLPVGKIRIRQQGSSGGHKGMESIIDCLKSQDFPRIRVGIGRPGDVDNEIEDRFEAANRVVDFVLGDFTTAEEAVMREVYDRVTDAINCILSDGLVAAMNEYN